MEPRRLPSPAAGLALFTAVLVSNLGMTWVVAGAGLDENWLLAITPAMVLFWTAVALWLSRADVREALSLRLPSATDVLMAVPLAISFVVLSDQLASLTEGMIPEDVRLGWLRLVQIDGPLEWLFKMSTIAVGAAVSEELMFRGFIQNAFLRSMRRSSAVIWTSFLFMALHVLPLPSFAAAGLVLGFTALATRSILVPVLIHFVNNASALALVNLADLETLGDPVWTPPTILLPAVAIFVLTTGFFARRLVAESTPRDVATADAPEGEASQRRVEGDGPRRVEGLYEELAHVPPERRRLGFFVVAAAVVLGSLVLVALFLSSLYLTRPQSFHAGLIQALSLGCRWSLAPEASERTGEIESAFAALDASSAAGGVRTRALFHIGFLCLASSWNGGLDSAEVDTVLEAVREVQRAASPRRL